MKWLKWIGIVLAALLILPVVTLLILGQRKDAGHLHGSIEIAASPQQLFPWLVEGDKLKQWVSWLVEVRVPDPTVHGVGASTLHHRTWSYRFRLKENSTARTSTN